MSASLAEGYSIVAEAVRLHRDAGMKRALVHAAETLGLSPRRVRAYWYGEVFSVREGELAQLRARQEAAVRARLLRLDEERAALWRRLEDMEAVRHAEVVAAAAGPDAGPGCQGDRHPAGQVVQADGPGGVAARTLPGVSAR